VTLFYQVIELFIQPIHSNRFTHGCQINDLMSKSLNHSLNQFDQEN